jgi:hypothetical protein
MPHILSCTSETGFHGGFREYLVRRARRPLAWPNSCIALELRSHRGMARKQWVRLSLPRFLDCTATSGSISPLLKARFEIKKISIEAEWLVERRGYEQFAVLRLGHSWDPRKRMLCGLAAAARLNQAFTKRYNGQGSET